MKKLMMAIAIVCAVGIAKASSVDWAIDPSDSIMAKDGVNYATGTAYILYTGAAAGDWTFYEDGTLDVGTGTDITGGGIAINDGYWNDDGSAWSNQTTQNGAYDVILTYKDADGKFYYVADTTSLSGLKDDPTDAVAGTFFTGETAVSIATVGEAVPEPTSGLLLLIGVAGLALRRRRA